jgi:hypothetical protein
MKKRMNADACLKRLTDEDREITEKFSSIVLKALDKYELAMIRARARLYTKNDIFGDMPFGFHLTDDGKHIVADKGEQEVLAVVRRLIADGLTIRRIVERLTADGLTIRSKKRSQA